MYTLHIQPSEIGEFTLADFLDHIDMLEEIRKLSKK